jgi:Domain of unknown function (DUF4331)
VPSPRSTHPRTRRATAAFAASAVAFGGAFALLGPSTGSASSHREAPLISNDPQADNTDLYAFVSPNRPNQLTFISNWSPFSEPAGGPNFYPFADDARHYIKIDNDGDAKPDLSYRWEFRTEDRRGLDTFLYNNGPVSYLRDPNLLFRQTYTLTEEREDGSTRVLVRNGRVAPSHVGDASMPNYERLSSFALPGIRGGGKSFAGQADDPFFLDLRIFDLLYGADLSERGDDTLAGFNVNSIALQIPTTWVTAGDDPVIGVWTTTERRSMRVLTGDGTVEQSGDWVQVSRLGNPLVNEVVIPAGLKDAFNALAPENDADVPQAVDRVLDPEVPKLIEAIYGIEAPETPRNDLFAIFLTGLKGLNMPAGDVRPAEMLRLNTSIPPTAEPNRLGVLGGDNAGFPNGRRLSDDVVDIALQALEGAVTVDENGAPTGVEIVEALADGDQVDANDKAFRDTFPYLALPHSGSDPAPHDGSDEAAAQETGAGSGGAAAGPGSSAGGPTGGSGLAYAAGLAGLGVVAAAAGFALRGRRLRLPGAAVARTHG